MLVLVHHAEAVGPDVDTRRPLSSRGMAQAGLVAHEAAARGFRPAAVWHSGKLRARQTAQQLGRACNPLAELTATSDLQPDDPPSRIRDRLRHEPRDILIAGHFPHLPRLLAMLLNDAGGSGAAFPQHGAVALESADDGDTWTEVWRIEVPGP